MQFYKKIIHKMMSPAIEDAKKRAEYDLVSKLNLTSSALVEADDIIVVGFPKSGNTWFQNLIAGVIYNIDIRNLPFALIHEIVPSLTSGYYRRYQSPTYFKSHELPKPEYKRVIYLVRDGRDAMVSYYHFQQGIGDPLSWEYLIEHGAKYYGRWHNHVQEWRANPYNAQMIMIRYEDLLSNPIQEMLKLCDFAEIERDEATLQWAIDNAAFDKMQQREKTFGAGNNFSDDHLFVRRGKKGSYKDEMPPEILKQFVAQSYDTLATLGYNVSQ